MAISAFDLFTIGIGPSSSHTVGPMRAAGMFAESLPAEGVSGLRVELFGSLGATGHGHGSVKAVVLGLSGEHPETVDPVAAEPLVARVRETGRLTLPGGREIPFDPTPTSSCTVASACRSTPTGCSSSPWTTRAKG